jgi:hypothetical protein
MPTHTSPRRFVSWPPPAEPGASPWIKWGECPAGFVLEGTFEGTFQGKFENLCGKLTREDGALTKFPLPAALERRLTGLMAGVYVRIRYLGMSRGQGEREYHDFSVEVDAYSHPELRDLPDDPSVPF